MNRKKILISAFVIIALVQLYAPAKMILDREEVLETGKEFRFRTEPVDPNDPFRGKYITLSYKDDEVKVDDSVDDWYKEETIYVLVDNDENGFAKLVLGTNEEPESSVDYIKTEIRYMEGNDTAVVDLPFDRFYMEETKAPKAETKYRQAQRDTGQVTWAVVNIKNGEAVLKDVMINYVSIRELVDFEEKK